jgi:hypothetical protein
MQFAARLAPQSETMVADADAPAISPAIQAVPNIDAVIKLGIRRQVNCLHDAYI